MQRLREELRRSGIAEPPTCVVAGSAEEAAIVTETIRESTAHVPNAAALPMRLPHLSTFAGEQVDTEKPLEQFIRVF